MKKLITTFSLLTIMLMAYGQTDIYLKINHKHGDSSLAFSKTYSTAGLNSVNYRLNRIEYYIAEIKLTHDGGVETIITDKWLLIDAKNAVNEFLGTYNITTLESISFGVGVEATSNHDDPSIRTSGHPLANKIPSMHWGWTAGYRFVALEGNTGLGFSQNFQIHALGDGNYHTQTHKTSGYLQNGDLTIELDADYGEALNSITVNGNLLNHGESGEAATLLSNFSNSVFSQSIVGLNEPNRKLIFFGVSPNPSNGEIRLTVDNSNFNLSYKVIDMVGREIVNGVLESTTNHPLLINQKGMYMINLFENGVLVGSEKVIIQ